MLPSDPESLLRTLALCPAASFHEDRVAAVITSFLDERRLPYVVDEYGNIIARYHHGIAPPLATVAHMDHPAFEITEAGDRTAVARLLGGVALEYFQPRTPVRIISGEGGQPIPGRITAARRSSERGSLLLDLEVDGPVNLGDWGVWEMEDFREEGDYLHLRAADDLAGCTVALTTLAALQAEGATAHLYAVFTRAEEVGLIGATLVAQNGALPRDAVVISLESSKVLPGVSQGVGPIIRVGDARSTFDASAEALLHAGAEHLRTGDLGFKVQRHLMSGGTCEATAFASFGYAVTGIALPLGNYHNMAEEGRLEAEYIHRADLPGAVALLHATVIAAPAADRAPARQRLENLAREHGERLRASAGGLA